MSSIDLDSEKFRKNLEKVEKDLPKETVERLKILIPVATTVGMKTALISEQARMRPEYSLELDWLYSSIQVGSKKTKMRFMGLLLVVLFLIPSFTYSSPKKHKSYYAKEKRKMERKKQKPKNSKNSGCKKRTWRWQ